MKPYYEHAGITIYHGDCREVLLDIEECDHIITDPPYARDVYYRALGHNTHAGSATPDRLYKGNSLAKLAAGEIGCIDDMLEGVAAVMGRITRRWVLTCSQPKSVIEQPSA